MIRLPKSSRRGLIMGVASAAFIASGAAPLAAKGKNQEKEVGAVEDLMREHGVLRRALLVYRESAAKLRAGNALDPKPIQQTAQLFRAFGEDYHERKLEEANIFPALRKAESPAGGLVDLLLQQHNRGREITEYILAVAGKGAIAGNDTEALARAFETFDLMYENHTAREDTIIFPAWKETMSDRQLREMGDKFEDIERQQFGHDGFEDAVKQIAQIEQALGFADLAQFTAPPPPKA